MASRASKNDLFPIYLALVFAVFVLATVALVLRHHPVLAILTACVSVLVALSLGGWLVAGPYLEADLVVSLKARGGYMPTLGLAAPGSVQRDKLLPRLLQKGVVSLSGENILLHEENIGRVLAFFIRMRLGK